MINSTNRKGQLRQSASILSNDPQKPKTEISITALVKQYIGIDPSVQIKLKGFAGERPSKKVTITSYERQPLKISDITSTIEDKVTYELNTIEEGKTYSFEVNTRSGIKETFRGKIVLKTNSQKKPEIALIISGQLNKEVIVAPPYLYFGIIDTAKETIDPKSFERRVLVSRASGGELTIEKLETSVDWIKTEIVPVEKGEPYTIVITLDKDRLPKGNLKENISINTKYSGNSEVVHVIIEGKII